MNDSFKSAEREARLKEGADKAFQEWIHRPMTRMGMSLIPAGENADAFQLLLRSAFDAGHACGQGAVMIELLEQVILRDKKRDP
jgi:hypothetical protein